MKDRNYAREIYLAGDCFWGTEKYLSSLPGVMETEVGYANGHTENPSYEEVCTKTTGFAETVHVTYDPQVLPLDFLLEMFLEIADPTIVRAPGDQYRTGIYYTDTASGTVVRTVLQRLARTLDDPITVEVQPLRCFYRAEEYHQKYLDKNPNAFCHVSLDKIEKAKSAFVNPSLYERPDEASLQLSLTPQQYAVTQENETEPPFTNAYAAHFEKGVYVDITSGEPLFVSADKFESGCGWPSFSKPVDPNVLREITDDSHGMHRTEVRSRVGDAHLGHVFPDGPEESGGRRYCINSAALCFIPLEQMKEEGYGYLIPLVEKEG